MVDNRKRWNRRLKRRIKNGFLTEEHAAEQFIKHPPSKSLKITAVPDTSWQFKGVGKGGSLGTLVDAISKSTDKAEQPAIPPPLQAYTEQDVRNMFGYVW